MIRTLLRPVALVFLITLLIWLAVVVYWQETQRSVTVGDIVLYMAGLPLAAVFGWLALRAGYRYATRQRPQQDQAAPADGAVIESAAATNEQERHWRIALLAVGMASGAGSDATQAYKALKDGEVRPAADAELRDADGFPVRTARVGEVDADAVDEWLERRAVGAETSSPDAAQLRALALLNQAMEQIVPVLQALAPQQPAAAATRLLVQLQVPAHWEEAARTTAAEYLSSIIDRADWPAERRAVIVAQSDEGCAALKCLDEFLIAANHSESQDLLLLAACDCAVDEDRIQGMEARGLLFSHRNQQGRVPGEAAAAVLARAPTALASGAQAVAIASRAALLPRQKSADAPGRIGHEVLAQAVGSCLDAAQIDATAICAVVCDADHRSSRTAETAAMMNDLFADLDPVAQCIRSGDALGHLGAAGALVALAVAAGAAQAEQMPVLLAAVAHPVDRAALVIAPFVPDSAATAAAA